MAKAKTKTKTKTKYVIDEKAEWIGVDLDGTLAYLDASSFPMIGKPVPAIFERVKRLIGIGKRVKIFTARADEEVEVKRIRGWLKANGLPENLEITNRKDYLCIEYWDDRAKQVIFNTGYFVASSVSNNENN